MPPYAIALLIIVCLAGPVTFGVMSFLDRHKHTWETLRVSQVRNLNDSHTTYASQRCYCGKTRRKKYRGKFTPEEL